MLGLAAPPSSFSTNYYGGTVQVTVRAYFFKTISEDASTGKNIAKLCGAFDKRDSPVAR